MSVLYGSTAATAPRWSFPARQYQTVAESSAGTGRKVKNSIGPGKSFAAFLPIALIVARPLLPGFHKPWRQLSAAAQFYGSATVATGKPVNR